MNFFSYARRHPDFWMYALITLFLYGTIWFGYFFVGGGDAKMLQYAHAGFLVFCGPIVLIGGGLIARDYARVRVLAAVAASRGGLLSIDRTVPSVLKHFREHTRMRGEVLGVVQLPNGWLVADWREGRGRWGGQGSGGFDPDFDLRRTVTLVVVPRAAGKKVEERLPGCQREELGESVAYYLPRKALPLDRLLEILG